ncbi:MAG TPA: hypothetical protein VNE41_10770 [Chitinophagaceae bacterium]|nr:hypothetical protein [Chitinophagaceae bacterium]
MKKSSFQLRRALGLFMACMTLFSLSSLAMAKPKPMIVKGEVLDMSCYMASGAHGASHMDCAEKCIKAGAPVGLLTSTGKVYLLVANQDKPEAYSKVKMKAGEQIQVTGTYADRGGVQGLVVNSIN